MGLGIEQRLGKTGIVGEEQQAFAGLVQPSDRRDMDLVVLPRQSKTVGRPSGSCLVVTSPRGLLSIR